MRVLLAIVVIWFEAIKHNLIYRFPFLLHIDVPLTFIRILLSSF